MRPIERADAIDLAKRRVEECFEDYRQSVLAYALWMEGYRKRQREQQDGETNARSHSLST